MAAGPDITVKLFLWRGKESNRNQSNKGKMRGGKRQTHDGLAQLPVRSGFVNCVSLTNNLLKTSLDGATANSFNVIKQKSRREGTQGTNRTKGMEANSTLQLNIEAKTL